MTDEFDPTPAPDPTPARAENTVPRHTFNYVIIAVAFFALGAILGVIVYDRVQVNTTAQIDAAVTRAVAAAAALVPQQEQVAVEPTRDPNQRYVVDTEGDPAQGPEDATVTIVEFGDFRCSYCRRFLEETMSPLLETYAQNVRFVYRDYPILGADSVTAALAGECAADQGQFWPFHDLVYANQQDMTVEAFTAHAESLDLDVDAFTACIDADETMVRVQRDFSAGQELGVSGTPTFFINGRILVGAQPYDVFAQYIEEALAETAS